MQHLVEKSIARTLDAERIKLGELLWKKETIDVSNSLSSCLTSKSFPIIGTKIANKNVIE